MIESTDNNRKIRSRDPQRTSSEILQSATDEFAKCGYEGAKIQKIAAGAGCNPRLIYHYFGNKEGLYLAVLRRIYTEIREREDELNLEVLPPEEAIIKLAEFTFDFFEANTAFVSITRSENLLHGRFLAKIPEIRDHSKPLIDKISMVLTRGVEGGIFRAGMDPLQLYVSIVALSAHHINAVYSLSATFGADMHADDWRGARKRHVVALILGAVTARVSGSTDSDANPLRSD